MNNKKVYILDVWPLHSFMYGMCVIDYYIQQPQNIYIYIYVNKIYNVNFRINYFKIKILYIIIINVTLNCQSWINIISISVKSQLNI
jgi:hypothetical protein